MFETLAIAMALVLVPVIVEEPVQGQPNLEYELTPSTYEPSLPVDGVCGYPPFACGRHSGS